MSSSALLSCGAPKPVPAAVAIASADERGAAAAGAAPAAASASASAAPSSSFLYPSQLDLASIRDTLIRLEDSILFSLIERAQFRRNTAIYQPMDAATREASGAAEGASLLGHFVGQTERLHAQYRRYTSPCEHPFSDSAALPQPILPLLSYPPTIRPNAINHNAQVMQFYLDTVLPSICAEGDDGNFGSSAVCDVQCLQLLSKRIHYGKFVAESKFLSDSAACTAAIRAGDVETLRGFITKPVVEEQLLHRVRSKAAAYGRPPPEEEASASNNTNSHTAAASGSSASYKIPPAVVGELYERIMTMTKDVQIEYLMQRLEEEKK